MHILVINCGSSSIKAAIIDHNSGDRLAGVHVERIGEAEPRWTFLADEAASPCPGASHEEALAAALPELLGRLPKDCEIHGVGHRVVHGGDRFIEPTRIDDHVATAIAELSELAPLHNPANHAGIVAARKVLPDLLHVAVFDTAFHATLPRRAYTYALPEALCEKHKIRRYGFHGTSHAYVAHRAAEFLETDIAQLRLITCHLGNGSSVCGIEYGRSVETSMGMTPLEGLVMGTRCGDLDAGAVIHLLRAGEMSVDEIDNLLNRQSGLRGISGHSNDMRDIEQRAAEGDDRCRLAISVFAHRLRKYIGGYAAMMGGVDAIVFTAGIGENSPLVRHRVAQRLEFLGARLDEERNREAKVSRDTPVVEVSTAHSRTRLLAVATDEQHAIAQEVVGLVARRDRVGGDRTIPVAISARHIHLTQAMVERLFGRGHKLTPRAELSQPGQFACEETLDLIGPKRSIESVRVLGPVRSKNQVEISRTDEFWLGIDAPVRNSGEVQNSAGIALRGPKGTVQLKEGVICARRHIHMQPEDAAYFGVDDRDVVEVAIDSAGRDLIFGDVLVRVSPKYKLEMHIDTDEGNAAELNRGAEGLLVATEGTAKLTLRRTRHERGRRAD
jgi:acetate kinase